MFGSAASGEVEALLRARGIAIETGCLRPRGRGRLAHPHPGGPPARGRRTRRASPDGGPRDRRASLRRARIHPDRRPRARAGHGRRLRGRRRDDFPDQAGRDRHPAGGRGGRAHRLARRRTGGSAALPPGAARKAPHRRGVSAPEARSHEAGPARAPPPSTTCGGRRTRSAAATSPRGLARRRLTATRSRLAARSMSRSRYRRSGIESRWRSIPTARSVSTRNAVASPGRPRVDRRAPSTLRDRLARKRV